MEKDLDFWVDKAEVLVVETLKMHEGGYDPKLARLEKGFKELLALSMMNAYQAGQEEGGGSQTSSGDPSDAPVTMRLSFHEAQSLLGLATVVGLHKDGFDLPPMVRDQYQLFEQITQGTENDQTTS